MTKDELNEKYDKCLWGQVALTHPIKGHAYFAAYIYKIKTDPNKPAEWWVIDVRKDEVKRICNY